MSSGEFARNRDNFCYRHPDRQSFVLCQRCLRTICPECQTQSAVGVICPECMREQQHKQSPAQKRAQRRWGRRPTAVAAATGRPLVTYWIIGICVGTFLLQLLTQDLITQWLSFYAPYLYPDAFGVFQPWRLVTALFLHGSFWHLGLNMLALWMIGRVLEPLLGHVRFLVLYLIGGLGGAVAVSLLAFTTPVIGASGAIFALFGALVVIGRHIGAEVTGILIVLGINLAIGFIPGWNVSWQAHVGGLAAGLLVGLILIRTRRQDQRGLQIGLLIALTVILTAALLIPPALYL